MGLKRRAVNRFPPLVFKNKYCGNESATDLYLLHSNLSFSGICVLFKVKF